tara:strand:+ start:2431 stop:2988 length:558 start_codon:yes stop_codon:yes gene_type:complete
MAFQLSDGTPIPRDSAFSIGTINYPANWLRLSTAEEKTAAGIVEVADPIIHDSRFYHFDGTPKALDDVNSTDKDGNLVKNADGSQHITYGLKTQFKKEEKQTAAGLLSRYDWLVVRKAEKGTAIPAEITTFRDAVRTACNTREAEIDACSDTAALINLYGSTEQSDGTFEPNMTQYPNDPSIQVL